jgi:hypothetical protein
MLRLLVTANLASVSPILVTLMLEAILSSEALVLTRSTRRNIPEDCILHSHRRENLKAYTVFFYFSVLTAYAKPEIRAPSSPCNIYIPTECREKFHGQLDLSYLAKYEKLYIGKVVANHAFSVASVGVFYLRQAVRTLRPPYINSIKLRRCCQVGMRGPL